MNTMLQMVYVAKMDIMEIRKMDILGNAWNVKILVNHVPMGKNLFYNKNLNWI